MRVGIYRRVAALSQEYVYESVAAGYKAFGDVFISSDHQRLIEEADCVVLFGIGGDSKVVWDASRRYRKLRILLDKPYMRQSRFSGPRYYLVRVSINASQPIAYFQKTKHPSDRWDVLGEQVLSYSGRLDGPILFDGASNKYVYWQGLDGSDHRAVTDIEKWHSWGQSTIDRIREYSKLNIVYRPRPDDNPVAKIEGAVVSIGRDINHDLQCCRLCVSYGGNIGYGCVVAGIPHFAIGDSIARPISETDWSKIDEPFIPSEEVRKQWLSDLAYCQWTMDEFKSGAAWQYIRETLNA